MVIFLTSSFVEFQPHDQYRPKSLDESNGFKYNLEKYWKDNCNFLMFASNPDDAFMSDHVAKEMYNAFTLAGLSIGEIRSFDNRNVNNYAKENGCSIEVAARESLKEAMIWADVFYLAGGHAPTENTFIKKCDLKNLIHDKNIFDGIFIGLSAGTLNAAKDVYLIPELEGESLDPNFVRFTDGLGLTSINVLPHSQYEKTVVLDGQKLVEDIIAKDSYGRQIYMIPDGSYFMIRDGITEYFGDGEIIENGVIRPLRAGIVNADNLRNRNESIISYNENVKIIDTILGNHYDAVFEVNTTSGDVEFIHASNLFTDAGIYPVNIDNVEEIKNIFSKRYVVKDEKEPFLVETSLTKIQDEISKKGTFVRTVHIDVDDGVRAESIRINEMPGCKQKLIVTLTNISMILDRDWMTDEYSRDGFIARAQKLLKLEKYKKGYSIVYTNVQGFKAINDILGTFNGDMVIFQIRELLIKELEPILLARLESDHFVVLTETEKLSDDKFKRICHQSYIADSKEIPFLIRAGVYNIEDTSVKVQRMIDNAKLAENSITSKHGIAYAFCDEKMREDYMSQRVLLSELDNALENGEFKTYYQPIVDAKTEKIVSAEALIRWQHSKKGMISPGQFIPLFEKEGVITKIDKFMINSVLEFNKNRMKKCLKIVPCAVNLSRVDFYDTDLLEVIEDKIAEQENIGDMIKLEVTESAYSALEIDAFVFLNKVKRNGITILLDDFGSGMSSFSTLESFEFDVVKLDLGFVRKIGKSAKTEAIIKHIIGLSHDIGAKVIAEGVETKEHLEFLRESGCDMIQGFYFYKPMPAEEFEKLLDNE